MNIGEMAIEFKRKSNGIIPVIVRVEKVVSAENVKIVVEAKTADEEGLKKVVLIKNGIKIEEKEVEGTKITNEFLLRGNGIYQVQVVGKNRKRAVSQEIQVTEVPTKIGGTLKAGSIIDGKVLLTVKGEATGTSIAKVEIYKGKTTKVGEIPIPGEEVQIQEEYQTGYIPFYEETEYVAKIIASTGEVAETNTVVCRNDTIITTREDLRKLSTVVNEEEQNFKGKKIILKEDINMQGITHDPIGYSEFPFEGEFDGELHTISNLTIGYREAYPYVRAR